MEHYGLVPEHVEVKGKGHFKENTEELWDSN